MPQPTLVDLRDPSELPTNPAGGYNGRRTLAQIKTVIVHWWGTPTIADEMKQLRDGSHYHAFVRNWSTNVSRVVRAERLTYHYAIGQSGTIYWINALEKRTWHVNNGNDVAIGINHMIGQGQFPSNAMMDSSEKLIKWLADERVDIPVSRQDVWGHGECGKVYGGGPAYGANSTCPGPDLLRYARAFRKGQPAPPPIVMPQPPSSTHTFYPETGFYVSYGIRDYYMSKGGHMGYLGYPLSNEFRGRIPDGGLKIYTLQIFERGVLHWYQGEGVGEMRTGPLLRSLFEAQEVIAAMD